MTTDFMSDDYGADSIERRAKRMMALHANARDTYIQYQAALHERARVREESAELARDIREAARLEIEKFTREREAQAEKEIRETVDDPKITERLVIFTRTQYRDARAQAVREGGISSKDLTAGGLDIVRSGATLDRLPEGYTVEEFENIDLSVLPLDSVGGDSIPDDGDSDVAPDAGADYSDE